MSGPGLQIAARDIKPLVRPGTLIISPFGFLINLPWSKPDLVFHAMSGPGQQISARDMKPLIRPGEFIIAVFLIFNLSSMVET